MNLFALVALLAQVPPEVRAQPPVSPPPVVTLREAVAKALDGNPDVATARLRMAEAELEAAITRTGYLPQVNATVGYSTQTTNLQGVGLIFPGFPSRVGPYRVFNARPVATQTILDAPLLTRIRAARLETERAKHQIDAMRDTVALSVIDLYLQALQAESRVIASRARLITATALLDQVKNREQAGASSKLDVARSEEEYHNEESTLVAAERDLRVLKVMILRVTGSDLPESFQLKAVSLAPLDELPSAFANLKTATADRPEVKADGVAIDRSKLDTQAARRQYWPTIAVSGDYGVLGAGINRNLSTYTAGVSVNIPVWTSGRIEKEIAAAKVRKRQAEQQARRTKLEIEEQARRSVLEWQAARESLTSFAKAAAAARESVELSRLRLGAGLATTIDTTVAQGRLASAEDAEIRSRYEVIRAQAGYARSLGRVMQFVEGL